MAKPAGGAVMWGPVACDTGERCSRQGVVTTPCPRAGLHDGVAIEGVAAAGTGVGLHLRNDDGEGKVLGKVRGSTAHHDRQSLTRWLSGGKRRCSVVARELRWSAMRSEGSCSTGRMRG
jgi:hypothetical protein